MQVLYRGAESVISLGEYDEKQAIFKDRVKKGYRLAQLDDRLRRERTKNEAKLLRDARSSGVPTPQVYSVDDKECRIIMEYVNGERVKDILIRTAGNSNEDQRSERIAQLCEQVGRSVGRLHAGDIVHGDLTTSNMVVQRSSGKVFFLDFGLGEHSRRSEDKGTDLKLLYDALKSTHFAILGACWSSILSGYRQEYKNAENVIEKVELIGGRGRYVRRIEGRTGRDPGKVQGQEQVRDG